MANAVQSFVHDLMISDLPPEVCDFGRRCLLDLIGVAASGATTDMSRIMRNHAATQFGAALSGGVTIDAVDARDGHKLTNGHVGGGGLCRAVR